jgi:uncharacterized protein
MPDEDELAHSRRARLAIRRRRYRWAGVFVAAVVVGAAGTVAAFTFTDDSTAAPGLDTLTGISTPDDGTETSAPTLSPDEEFAVRPLSHAEPLRLWIGGDSLAGALGPALGDTLGATGIVEAHVDYKVSSGLVPGPRDWEEYATELLAERNPEVVVFMIGTNDASVVSSFDGNDDGVADWEPDYRLRVAAMMDLLVGEDTGRTVVWIGAPPMRDEDRDEGVVGVNRVMREEAAKRAPEVLYLESYPLFADEDGEYTDRITTEDGETVRVRIGDGVHFTPAGAEHLAEPVFALLDGRFRLTQQAVLDQPIGYTIEEGGESSGGSGNRNNNRRNSGGSGTRSTTTVPADEPEPEPEPTPTTVESPPPTDPPATTVPVVPTVPGAPGDA